MNAVVENITFLGQAAVRVTTEKLEGVVVPGWGSNLISLRWLPTNTALLRTPESAEAYHARSALYGTPVLFPPNRIENGTFTFQGREYRFPITDTARNLHSHGVLRHAAWTVTRAEAEGGEALVETSLVSEDTPEVYAALPHRFTVRHQFRFTADAVELRFVLESRDEAPMPWGLGYHTTLLMPLTDGGSLERCTIQVPVAQAWALSDKLTPTGELTDYSHREALAEGMSLSGVKLDDVLLADPNQPVEAVMTDEAAGLRVAYTADKRFKHWVIFNNGGDSGFICPEPYTWVTNAPNLDLPYELTGVQVLAPGETAEAVTKLSVSAI